MDLGNNVRTTKRDPRNASTLRWSKLRFLFHRLWTKVHHIKCACAIDIAVFSAVVAYAAAVTNQHV